MIIYFWCIKRRICLLNLFSRFFCILSVSVVVYYFCSFTIVSVSVSDTSFRLAELIFGEHVTSLQKSGGSEPARPHRFILQLVTKLLQSKYQDVLDLRAVRRFFQHRRLCDCQTVTAGLTEINRSSGQSSYKLSAFSDRNTV